MLKRLFPYAVIFLVIQTLIRVTLLARAVQDVDFSFAHMISALFIGTWFDIVTASFLLLPLAFYHVLLPTKLQGGRWDRRLDLVIRFIFTFVLLFEGVSEHIFWTEFSTRLNFIAVDYLVYTQEVIGNIVESYPVAPLILGIAICTLAATWISLKFNAFSVQPGIIFKRRAVNFATILAGCVALYSVSNLEQATLEGNTEASEIAANGIYNLFYAFHNNEIQYDQFYAMKSDALTEDNARELLSEDDWYSQFVHKDGKDLTRIIKAKGKEQHKNVILVVMESLSAEYMGVFGNKEGLTPNLDRLAKEGVFFSNTYATGTRTVRGLEAVTLSIPPTPGQSIVRRPDNDNLFSLGFIFKDRGYDTKFIYGGYGYFDNMNAFFKGNGFDILDRTDMSKEETNFANVWGICDEDMFTRAIKEGDKSYANKKLFMHLIMTTSNHRPFTYPNGRIDIPSKKGRFGGIKYADYSVGRLIEEAKTKPWFKDTVFIFVSDHTAGAGGKAELDPRKYHIPMIFYAPGTLKPSEYKSITSQIDMAPILLGMLNFSYYTKFYGEDLLNDSDEVPHAFISNYQKVALVKDNGLTVLAPKQKIEQYSWPDVGAQVAENDELASEAIAYYQSASWWKEQQTRIPTVVK